MKQITTWLLGAALLLLPSWTAEGADSFFLQILRHPEGSVLRQVPVNPGDVFQLKYTHSSDGTPVLDLFRVGEDGGFVLLEEQYEWYGAGLESHPQAVISFKGDRTRVTVNRRLQELLLRVGRVSNQVILSGDTSIVLAELVPGGSLVRIRIVRHGA
ncbi:MAG: hypothetical protein CVU61_04155 [Deltaproteobacteria bacterium HGW-Deltaproteobacteria-19]|jgi:hypothetical protein|nr:MAG: hypothetical protein CVU61_04155 [Deltaproteobacteria bacterium HGW-Deltaproteobacteria-19]